MKETWCKTCQTETPPKRLDTEPLIAYVKMQMKTINFTGHHHHHHHDDSGAVPYSDGVISG